MISVYPAEPVHGTMYGKKFKHDFPDEEECTHRTRCSSDPESGK
jgi:hypothetical protein